MNAVQEHVIESAMDRIRATLQRGERLRTDGERAAAYEERLRQVLGDLETLRSVEFVRRRIGGAA